MSFDTEVLIIGAGLSGLGLAVQLIRQFGIRNFEVVDKGSDVGGTWNANTYPGCGCDVPSHFYSYSFTLNPNWTHRFSMQPEIQAYYRSVADKYSVVRNIQFHSIVEKAEWDDEAKVWNVTVRDIKTKTRRLRRAKILVSAVGALSLPKKCEIPGLEKFKGKIFHSAEWDHSFDWKGKDVVVLGNGCSATQFLPILATGPFAVNKITQFANSAHYISARENPSYSPTFKAFMRYIPLAQRLYRAAIFFRMERDYLSLEIEGGKPIREELKKESEIYVKNVAPSRYWDFLLSQKEPGCKRKVLDTEYLTTLHNSNVELVTNDPVQEITESGIKTASGREVHADAIVLAIGFATQQMLAPMEILGRDGLSLNQYWASNYQSVAQAYFGTCVPSFPNFFILMGPNSVTSHLSVSFTSECQANFVLRLVDPILRSLPSYRSRLLHRLVPSFLLPTQATVEVKHDAARKDSAWNQTKAKTLVSSSGCSNWAVDKRTGWNSILYPDWQYLYWLRSVFWKKDDFIYREKNGNEVKPSSPRKPLLWLLTSTVLLGSAYLGREWIRTELPGRSALFNTRDLAWAISAGKV